MGICDNSLDLCGRGAANKENKTARLEESKEGSILPSFLVQCAFNIIVMMQEVAKKYCGQ